MKRSTISTNWWAGGHDEWASMEKKSYGDGGWRWWVMPK